MQPMPLTILNVSYPLSPVCEDTAGGAEHILAALDHALVSRGHNSFVIGPEGSHVQGRLIPIPLPHGVIDEETRRESHRCVRERIQYALEHYAIDAIHLHGIDFLDYLPETRIPTIVTLHLPPSWYAPQALRPTMNVHFICVSHSQAQACPKDLHVDVIENGVHLPPIHPRNSSSRPYALSLGRICPEKGFHLAMDAASLCGIRFLLAGTVFDYPEHRQYFNRQIAPRLDRNHRLLGAVGLARKNQLLSDATCLLIPSLAPETSSLVAMEALSCGTPVIAFPSGALAEIVEHGRTGFLVHSVEQMAEAISHVDSIDPAYCRRQAELRFSADRMTAQHLDFYRRVATTQFPVEAEVLS